MELERKFCGGEPALRVEDGALISGYASLFGATDQGGDVVEPGAYAASLKRLNTTGGRVRMLWQHDPARPIGIWDEVREDSRGLWVKGRILTDVAQGRDAAALVGAGAIDGLSIGYRTVTSHKGDHGRRHLSELELWEVSLVTFPMLSQARVGSKAEAKSDPSMQAMQQMAGLFRRAQADLARRHDE